MKRRITYKWTIIFVITLQLFGCIDDEEIDFPERSQMNIESSNALVSVLNNIASDIEISNDSPCFTFVYPIILGYNNESNITIEDYDGLVSVISSQASNFNITGLVFPIEIILSNSNDVVKLTNENELFDLLENCSYTTFRDEFDRLFMQCFTLNYPIDLFDEEGNEVRLTSTEEFDTFYTNQSDSYQLDFQFPLSISIVTEGVDISINSIYDFYEIINDCVGCPDLRFTTTEITPNTFDFDPDFEVLPQYELFWIINDEILSLIDTWGGAWDTDTLVRQFEPGQYTICIRAITPNCSSGIDVCQNVIVPSVCPNLSFTGNQEPESFMVTFVADFIEIQTTQYQWFVDDVFIEEDGAEVANGDNRLIYNFEAPGEYQVCIKTTSPFCPEGRSFCETIVVEPICPDLFFSGNQEPDSFTYDFTANFENIANTSYQWIIDDMFVENDGANAPNSDNSLIYNFEAPGSYEVCIRTESPLCLEGTSFCETIVLDPICPEMTLIVDPLVGNRYFFFPQITSSEPIEVVLWSIDNGVEQPRPSTEGFEFEFPGSGTYTVCGRIEATNNCPDGVRVCEEITIPQ
ncbi:hypothetical protein J8281_09120 [Aquimarina sp. U1-2]|uniref:hypothetical protein n=1 Tax=Aquimarina sp. U1-2 TaxID=2823141 RepID=UPI001AECAE74|nr:hypothetical protein [Aquimarina sp. U1-2]MBP2832344.1 hypothetical protein [Aquimarina sp. U1-2]